MPLRWMSKEALQQGKFGQFSDVWAFGVTLWEIFSYGRQPYERFENLEVIEQIAMRNLLDCPVNCPTNVYSLMVECWHENADRRPTFTELFNRLQTWTVLSPAASMQNRASSTHSGSSGANRGSRQSSSNQSGGSLLRGTGIGPTPLQTLINLNGVHPYHQHQHGLGRSPKPRPTQPIQGDASPLMRGTNRGAYTYSESGEEDDSE